MIETGVAAMEGLDTYSLKSLVEGKVKVGTISSDVFRMDLSGFNFAEDGFVRVNRANRPVRRVGAELANAGYVTDGVVDGLASFIHIKNAYPHWGVWLESAQLSTSGIVYTYVPPEIETDDPGLLVVFSSISDKPNSPEMIRYFNQNFASIGKFVPKDVGILRLSDIGGLVGAFYMNTLYDSGNEEKVSAFLEGFIAENAIRKDRVVLYGVSKGGTGALLHGVNTGVRVVSVDPIVNDEHYLVHHNDAHFVNDVFPERKESRFTRLFKQTDIINSTCVITSSRSPQMKYISAALPRGRNLILLESGNPRINDHPDVGPNTVNSAVMLMNMCFYDLGLSAVVKSII